MEKPFPAYTGDEPYTFVCYAHVDSDVVFEEMRHLHKAGVHLWYDDGIKGGEVWRAEIATAIDGAAAFVCFISPSSVKSLHCLREINYALDRGIKIVPVYLETTELPADLRIGLSNVQALFLDDSNLSNRLKTALESLPSERPTPIQSSQTRSILPRGGAIIIALATFLVVGAWFLLSNQSSTYDSLSSIGVMPFDERSPDSDEEWLGYAIAEVLAENLARIERLRIPGATSTAQLKRAGAGVSQIGSELDVGTIIEGTVQRVGEELQISARWIRVDDESILWSKVYPSSQDDILDTQRVIAADVAEAIRSMLSITDGPEFFASERYVTYDIRAWKAVRDAINLVMVGSGGSRVDDFRNAAALAREAINLDPNWAEAHGALALIATTVGNNNAAAAAKRRALELDPYNVAAHATFVPYNMAKWDFATAAAQLDQAELGQSETGSEIASFENFQRVLWMTDRKEDALEYAMRAAELEPLVAGVHYRLGMAYLVLDEPDYANAIPPLEESIRLENTNLAQNFLSVAYAGVGRESDARDAFLETLELRQPSLSDDQREAFSLAFDMSGWDGMLKVIADDMTSGAGTECSPLALHARMGDRNGMYRCLEENWSGSTEDWPRLNGWPQLFNLLLSPIYSPYRDEPRFDAIVQRVRERIDQAAGTGDEFGGIPVQ